ncbi:MAG: carboxypeptidase regulatory-like domain-containing protein [Saprospiraceae bacterium]
MKNLKLFFLLTSLVLTAMLTSCGEDNTTVTPTGDLTDVAGKVSDDTGAPLSGVSVTSVADAANTTTTAADGTYTITVDKNDKLTFSKEGYETVETSAATTLDVTLNRGASLLFADYFAAAGNVVADPASGNWGTFSPYPAGFDNVNFKGAVDPAATPWYDGWTFYSNIAAGNTKSDPIVTGTIETWTDADMQAAGDVINWIADKTYVLDGFVFVNDGQTLNIEAGTVIEGKPGEDVNASALIVARGGTINALGTADAPIIFTYEGDTGGSDATLRGQWGGLIVLGKARLNSSPGETAIEGIPTSEVRGLYGGNDDADNSGTIRYVSIRHGGTNIGADNEINGLTLGGVGSGTTIEYVEIIGNKDDAIEWFGGTVKIKYLISAYCADDGLDYDEGYRGQNQFVIVHQDPAPDAADRGGEHDGGTDPETGTPYATPVFYNVTSIGNSSSRTITFRDNAGGEYHNSIFMGYGKGVDIEDLADQNQDSYKQWQDGNLKLENNIFFNIKAGTSAADLFIVKNN